MNNISCDICMDLLPLVADDVASEDSRQAVLGHIDGCPTCKALYEQGKQPPMDTRRVTAKLKRQLFFLALALMVVGAAFGIAIAGSQLMFYNIIIMPTIGAISYAALKGKSLYTLAVVFVSVYLRWLPDTFGYVYEGSFAQAFVPPLFWALIYAGLFALGIVIAFLLHFGLRKESHHEENS